VTTKYNIIENPIILPYVIVKWKILSGLTGENNAQILPKRPSICIIETMVTIKMIDGNCFNNK